MNPLAVRSAHLRWFRWRPPLPLPRIRNGTWRWLTRRQLFAFGIGGAGGKGLHREPLAMDGLHCFASPSAFSVGQIFNRVQLDIVVLS